MDYDDIISQNILIRKEESSNSEKATVEVHTKQSEDYESQYNRQAEMYNIGDKINLYVDSTLNHNSSSNDTTDEESEASDYEEALKRAPIIIYSDDSNHDTNSSDSDWARPKKARRSSILLPCDECDKKCTTKRGLMMHKRSHVSKLLKEAQTCLLGSETPTEVQKKPKDA